MVGVLMAASAFAVGFSAAWILQAARTSAAVPRLPSTRLLMRNWLIGAYAVEYEQSGEDGATYGARLLADLARDLRRRVLRSALARYTRPFRDSAAVAESAGLQTIAPIDQIRRTLRTAELPPPQADLGEGPLIPEDHSREGSAS